MFGVVALALPLIDNALRVVCLGAVIRLLKDDVSIDNLDVAGVEVIDPLISNGLMVFAFDLFWFSGNLCYIKIY